MSMLRSFGIFKIVCFFGVFTSQLLFAESGKQQIISSEKTADATKSVNTGNSRKTDAFDYTHTFYREKSIVAPDGKTETTREYVKQTLPGEELLAVATYTYKKEKSVNEVVFTLPVPKEAFYVDNSATNEKYVWFSIDDGKNWARFSDLRITQSDGTKRIAQGKDVTHLQWRMQETLRKGDVGTLEYKIIIR